MFLCEREAGHPVPWAHVNTLLKYMDDCETIFKKVVSVLSGTSLLQCNFYVIAFTLLLPLRLSSPIPSSHSPFIPSVLSFLWRGLCLLKKIKTNVFRAEQEQEKRNYNIAQLSFLGRWRET